jgi:hypothetical protein
MADRDYSKYIGRTVQGSVEDPWEWDDPDSPAPLDENGNPYHSVFGDWEITDMDEDRAWLTIEFMGGDYGIELDTHSVLAMLGELEEGE